MAKSKKKSVLNKVVSFFSHSPYHACIVGGYVRDLIMGRGTEDIDITVEGDAIRAAQDLNQKLKGSLKVYLGFKTATIMLKDLRIDLATARTECYPGPAALPVVKPSGLLDDFQRRDFTINALAISLSRDSLGELYDPYNGIMDIRSRLIRILHGQSFIDDPTRIFRALRYKNRLGFRLERTTLALLKKAVARRMVSRLTGRRILNEIKLIFEEPNPLHTVRDLSRLGIYRLSAPDVKMLGRLGNSGYYYYLAATNARNLPVTAREKKIINEMPRLQDTIKRLRSAADNVAIYNALNAAPLEIVKTIQSVAPNLKKKVKKYIAFHRMRPLLTGTDLKRAGLRPGPQFKRKLNLVFELQLKGKIKNRRQALEVMDND